MDCSDIFFKTRQFINENEYIKASLDGKKNIIKEALKKYTIEKLNELGNNLIKEKVGESSLEDLFSALADRIPIEKHFDTLRFFTHYLLEIMGTLQGHSIIWWSYDKDEPNMTFIDNIIDKLETNPEKEDYKKTFLFVYDIFMNEFQKKNYKKIEN